MIILGLTGSIGMGKSTTAEMFRARDIPVHDADATVHALYQNEAVALIEEAFPGTTDKNGVDRSKLGKVVVGDEVAIKRLEAIIHPLVWECEQQFLREAADNKAKLVVLDIPLLFETGGDERVDGIIVVTAPKEVQRERVLARDNMDEEKFTAIHARQYPDAKKREKANFIIDTSLGLESAQTAVKNIIEDVLSEKWKPENTLVFDQPS